MLAAVERKSIVRQLANTRQWEDLSEHLDTAIGTVDKGSRFLGKDYSVFWREPFCFRDEIILKPNCAH